MSNESEGREAAEKFRSTHRLGEGPLSDLPSLIEETTGADVAILPVPDDEHGLTAHDPIRDVTIIGVAQNDRPLRQRFTLAHELAHIVFTDYATSDGSSEEPLPAQSPKEVRANAFARHLLIPQPGLKDFLGEGPGNSMSDLSKTVRWFQVSPQVALIALHEAGYIDQRTKQTRFSIPASALAAQFGWADQYRSMQQGAQLPRAPRNLVARTIEGYRAGVVSEQTIATLRGKTKEEITTELAAAGIYPEHAIPVDAPIDDDFPRLPVDLGSLSPDEKDGC